MLDYFPRVARVPVCFIMSLEQLLSEKQESILRRWFDLMAESHPAAASPLARNKDEFANPEAHVISREANVLFDELLQDRMNSERVCASLDSIIKIRAVQDLSPSQAVSFVFLLKQAVADELGREIEKRHILGQWLEFESRIDKLVSLAFDIYMHCREKVCQLRVKEVKAEKERAFRLLELVDTAGKNRIEAPERPA